MRIQSIRFSEKAWAAIQGEAADQGISASAYVREAALMRLAYDAGHSDAMLDFVMRMGEGFTPKTPEGGRLRFRP